MTTDFLCSGLMTNSFTLTDYDYNISIKNQYISLPLSSTIHFICPHNVIIFLKVLIEINYSYQMSQTLLRCNPLNAYQNKENKENKENKSHIAPLSSQNAYEYHTTESCN